MFTKIFQLPIALLKTLLIKADDRKNICLQKKAKKKSFKSLPFKDL